jgi:hypothetical protein
LETGLKSLPNDAFQEFKKAFNEELYRFEESDVNTVDDFFELLPSFDLTDETKLHWAERIAGKEMQNRARIAQQEQKAS